MRKRFAILAIVVFCAAALHAGSPGDSLWEFVQARYLQDKLPYTVDVTITASIPSMGKVGRLHAMRRHPVEGKFSYEGMQFEGDKMIKTSVISRYLSAELEAQRPEEKLATQISPANYEFKLKAHEMLNGRDTLVFQVKPLKKRTGLFHGHIWIDAETRQPVKEVGKLAKLPSIWVKEINFVREYANVDGVAVPSRINSEVSTRIVGKARINIEFQNYRFDGSNASSSGPAIVASDQNQ